MYREIAKNNKVSMREVKEEMKAAINSAYVNPTTEALHIPCNNIVPTIEEFVNYASKKIEKED